VPERKRRERTGPSLNLYAETIVDKEKALRDLEETNPPRENATIP